MNSQADTYCILPFIHAQAETNGHLLPCCRYDQDLNNPGARTLKDFDTWWHHDLQSLREDLLAGRRHSQCRRCWDDEDRGVQSYRQDCLQMFEHHGRPTEPLTHPIFWMMGIGSYCNIRCIMCSPFKSTNWMAEFERNRPEFQKIGIDFEGYPRGAWSSADLEPLTRVAQDAEMIHFSGGEPLMTSDYLRVLRSVRNPGKTVLHINSNLQELSEEWLEILPQFQTHINVSLEGVGAANDYIRYGSSWTSIVANIQRLRERGVDVGVTHAFGRTSLQALIPLLEFCLQQDMIITFTPLRWPDYLGIGSAPHEERQQFLTELNHRPQLEMISGYHRLAEFVSALEKDPYLPELDQKFWQFIDFMDRMHNMNYREIINAGKT